MSVTCGAGRRDGVSIIVPTLNEAGNIPVILERLRNALDGADFDYEVVLADDSSADGTPQVAERVAGELGVALQVVSRTGPRSLALSVVEGARAARYDVVLVMDADLSHPPERVVEVARPVLEGRADVSVGSRYEAGGEIGEWPLARRLLSGVGTLFARRLTRVRDPLSGFFACRRELLDGARGELRPRGYKILLELLARAHAAHAVEVPIEFSDRAEGSSKLGMRQILEFSFQLGSLLASRAAALFRAAPTQDAPSRGVVGH